MYGYAGKLLFVDLTEQKIWEEELTQEFVDLYYGGYGIGAKILFDRMKPGADPLGPDNMLGFVTGPLVATGAFFSGRYMVVHKSPMTGMWNDANSGGYFAPELKRAGFDGVFFTGVSEKPVYLYIKDGTYELRDAQKFWEWTRRKPGRHSRRRRMIRRCALRSSVPQARKCFTPPAL